MPGLVNAAVSAVRTGTEFRPTKGTHLRDLIEVGLLDAAWLTKLPPALAERLKQLLETPNG